MRESRIIGVNKDVHSHSGGVTRYDCDVAIVGDQCLGCYSLCAIILVATVPWHAPIPAPSEILPPRGMRRRFNPRAEPGDETANAARINLGPHHGA